MGIASSNRKFLQSFEQIQQLEDNHFGNISIFHSKSLNKYIFKTSRTFIINDHRHQNFQKQVKCMQQLSNNLAIMPLLFHEGKQYGNLCVNYQIVEMYSQYLNFTLADLLRSGKNLDLSQLWLCLKQLLAIFDAVSKINFQFEFDLENIFITLKGNLAIYPICLQFTEYSGTHKNLHSIIFCMLKLATNSTSQTLNMMLSKLQSNYQYKNMVIFLKYMLEAGEDILLTSELLAGLEEMKNNGVIKIANEIKLNRFRYIIPTNSSVQDKSNSEEQNNKQKKLEQNKQLDTINKHTQAKQASKVQKLSSHKKEIKNEKNEQIKHQINKLQNKEYLQDKKKLTRADTQENLAKLKKQLQKFQAITPSGLVKRAAQPLRMFSEIEQKKMENLANRTKMQSRKKQVLEKASLSENSSLQVSKTSNRKSKTKQNKLTFQHSFKSSKKSLQNDWNNKVHGLPNNKLKNKCFRQ